MTVRLYATVVLATLLLSGGTPVQASPTLTSAYAAQQQTKKVTGKVTDSSGEPVIGATVTVKGTKIVTVTDASGNYTINAPAGSQLEVTYVGFAPRTINVGKGGNYNITISEDEHTTGEVVVTAMGIKKEKKALGYAVTELNSAEILKNKNTNVINSLAGKVPGLNITQSSGAAGAGASIVMRGANSTAEGRSNQPLFVVDGVIYDNSTQVTGNSGTDGMTRNNTTFSNRAMDINPEDIADISVLKGAAAAALYGSRAADGAIIITTKKGEAGTTRIDYTGKMSTSFHTNLPETQKLFGRGAYSTNGVFSDQTYNSWGKAYDGTEKLYDNIGNFFQSGRIFDNNVSVSGGSKNNSFYLSLSNFDQDGIVRN
ncbi:MAG: TonB-dependent receptor plug domain-containing protein, partial [Prevotellaceae bacterium]|nr:TonB-dependent receptor plug domain-containing protein [Prevotellaceae bacterium]